MDMNRFGERLTVCRQNKNMTQEEFASRMGVTPQAVSKWERGQSLPDISLISGICGILDVDANELLNITVKSHITENDDIKEQNRLLSCLLAEPVKIVIGRDIIPAFTEGLKSRLIQDKRLKLAEAKGILMPVIHVTDDDGLKPKEFRFISYDRVLYREELKETDETTFTYIIDLLYRSCGENYASIINKHIVKILIDNIKDRYPGVVCGVIPERISYLTVLRVLKGILVKKLSIHNLIGILEVIEEEVIDKGNTDVSDIVNKVIGSINNI